MCVRGGGGWENSLEGRDWAVGGRGVLRQDRVFVRYGGRYGGTSLTHSPCRRTPFARALGFTTRGLTQYIAALCSAPFCFSRTA